MITISITAVSSITVAAFKVRQALRNIQEGVDSIVFEKADFHIG